MRDVKITMLGGFSVSVNGKIIDEKSRRSRNLWTLLEYICAFHGKEIPQSELIDLLYDDSANPASALKTQMCRVREVLDELDESCGKEMIVNCAGGYAWNDKLECSFDTDEFERLCKTAFRSSEHFESRIKLIWQAIDIYKGDFLPSLSAEPWAVPILSYYHSMYIKAIYLAIDLLTDNDRQRDIITICQRALLIDQYDEYIHSSYVKALAELGDKKGAREQYLNAIDVFYNKLGVNPSEDFLELYKQTVYACQDTVLELDDISNMLNEDSDAIGAFYCEYEFFKHIFKLEKKATSRDGREMHLCVLSISDENGNQLNQKKLTAVMDRLVDCIKFSLRSSDVFARVSLSQYVVLLTSANIENGTMIMKRIAKRFRRDNPKLTAKISYQIKSISKK